MSLTGVPPQNVYKSILHFIGTIGLTNALQFVVDGLGNRLPIQASISQVQISNTLFQDSFIQFTQTNTPATPPPNTLSVYAKADNNLYIKNSSGVETKVGSGGGGSTTLAGLTDVNVSGTANDDVLQYQTSDNKWHNITSSQFKTNIGLSAVASSGAYADLSGTPTLGTAASHNVGDFLQTANNLSELAGTASTARTNLGLGSSATHAATDFLLVSNNLSDINSSSTAFNNISGLTTLGDIIYGGASGTRSRLAGDTTNARVFLREQSSGGVAAAPAWDTVTKTDVGLSNVENTALSTWAGSANITTLGTITTGTWNGTILDVAHGGTNTATPGLVAGTNITSITGTWPNQTINASGGTGATKGQALSLSMIIGVA